MKWFKHDSTALHDAKIEKLIMKFGIEGYGLYFACVEMIAGNISPENVTFELEHDAELLAYKFKVDTLKIEEIMKYCVSLGLFEFNSTNGRIVCTKLAKRLDNTASQNGEIKKTLSNFNLLKADKKRIEEKRREKKKKRLSFVKPSLEIIQEYLNERNIKHFTAEQFYDFYESKNWMIGKNKMKNWQAAVRTWERRNDKQDKKIDVNAIEKKLKREGKI